ncbi:MAG: stage II sporulation protein P [Firmicutes bacterium]|jgi:stage II sporulation protein P|nr:stage II sporulation protein P [Bacillota bacterium]
MKARSCFRSLITRQLSLVILLVGASLVLGIDSGAKASGVPPEGLVGLFERTDGGYFTLIDEDTQREVTKAARFLDIGDSYIDSDNRRYEVTRIEDDTVYVKHTDKGTKRTASLGGQAGAGQKANRSAWLQGILARVTGPAPRRVAIYCTHSDESYVPTSGTSSKEWGDVYKVGSTLKQEFEKRGFTVDLSYNNHNPHDSQAYIRSRRTATELLRNRPLVVLDVHRDAVPEHEYRTTVQGSELSKIQLVVGRQNQNRDANLAFAQTIKAEADRQYPGLVKGIFDAKGNYNQDLAPRSILLEFGTHETSLGMAEKAADLISDVLPAAAGAATKPMGTSGYRTVLWIVGLVVAAGVAVVVVNAMGWQGIRNFFGREFASAFGIRGKRRQEKEPAKTTEKDSEKDPGEGPETDSDEKND